MAVHTFSSRTKDDEAIQKVKDKCDDRGIIFSRLIIDLLKQWDDADEQQVRDSNKTA